MSQVERSAFENQVGWDGELPDPDGGGPLAAHGSAYDAGGFRRALREGGDGFTAFEEYRGFVGACNGTDKFKHRRLSACEKEILIEVDVMKPLTLPTGGSGSSTALAADKITDTTKSWAANSFQNLWVLPSNVSGTNNGISWLIKENDDDSLTLAAEPETYADITQGAAVGDTYQIHAHQPPTLTELTAPKAEKGIMAMVADSFWETAGIRVYYIIDDIVDEQGEGGAENRVTNTSQERINYANDHRQKFNAAGKEDYRRFIYLVFADHLYSGGFGPYNVLGSTAYKWDDEWKPTGEHGVFVGVSTSRNAARMWKEYLGCSTEEAERLSIARNAVHELGHAVHIMDDVASGAHVPDNQIVSFKIASNYEPTPDRLSIYNTVPLHPHYFSTNAPGVRYEMWKSQYDTVEEIFNALPPLPGGNYSKQWVNQESTKALPSWDLTAGMIGIPIETVASGNFTDVKVHANACWANSEHPSPSALVKQGDTFSIKFKQGTASGETGRISVKYSVAAPSNR